MILKERPAGITLMAVLFFAIAAGLIVLAILGFMGFILTIWQTLLVTFPSIGKYFVPLAPLFVPLNYIISTIGLIAGIAIAIDAVGLILLKKWAHSLALFVSIPLIVLIIGILFLWYLLKSEVKMAFGKK